MSCPACEGGYICRGAPGCIVKEALSQAEARRADVSHGAPSEVDPVVFLGDDPALALVAADPGAWSLAHPCDCEALCTCDEDAASLARLDGCT